ncbi:MAG: D-alanyl-D-alanine carboxypeptidase [candidate division NC10 bacterium]|nr:D-alanyl-D-alanine carboxypeptidase [candidate division NC10 bacterium]
MGTATLFAQGRGDESGENGSLPWYFEGPQLQASSAILMDKETGQVLYEKDARERRPPASTTKILTALLVLERGKLGDRVRVSAKAASIGGLSLGLKKGQRILLKDLVTGMLLKSANDAALAAAEHVAGSEEAFVDMMNARVRAWGLKDTYFVNSHGLHNPDHYSTAYDLAVIARRALENPAFSRLVRSREATVAIGTRRRGRVRVLKNYNRLLNGFEGADGIKTGYTKEAGRTLVASASRGGRQLIAVLLNDPSRWMDAAALLEYGFELLDYQARQSPLPRRPS